MHTIIRNKSASKSDFVFYSNRLIRLVVEHSLGQLPFHEKVRTRSFSCRCIYLHDSVCDVGGISQVGAPARVQRNHSSAPAASFSPHRVPVYSCPGRPFALTHKR